MTRTLALLVMAALVLTLWLIAGSASAQAESRVAQISAGGDHTCALLESGGLLCWGLNDVDQASPPDGEYLDVDAGSRHTCAVTSARRIVCWGRNTAGQSTVPDQYFSVVTNLEVAAGAASTCSAFRVYHNSPTGSGFRCWGYPSFTPTGNFTPSEGDLLAVGRAHMCNQYSIWSFGSFTSYRSCEGDNVYGQGAIPDHKFLRLDAGDDYTCGITSERSIRCWGRSNHGQTDPPKGNYGDIATGSTHACGITAAGSIRCWGRNNHDQTDAPGGTNWNLAAAGGSHSCAVNEDGKVSCWGRNNHGQLNVPASISATRTIVRHTVRATASPADGGTVSGHGDLREGSTATLRATPAEGYRFVRWVGDAEGSSTTIRLRVDADKSVIAVFELASGDSDDEPMIGDGAMTAAFPAGRIVARRLADGRTEFGYQPQGRERVLPAQRYFPANANVGRWLSSSVVIVDGDEIGRINAQLLADGRIEFAFTPTDGERILPSSRYFPASSSGGWLRSSVIGN